MGDSAPPSERSGTQCVHANAAAAGRWAADVTRSCLLDPQKTPNFLEETGCKVELLQQTKQNLCFSPRHRLYRKVDAVRAPCECERPLVAGGADRLRI